MDDKQKQVLLIACAALLGVFVLFQFVSEYAVNYVADKVIEKLYKEYSPSPYGPGVNPDKMDINSFHQQRTPTQTSLELPQNAVGEPYSWQDNWERQRR